MPLAQTVIDALRSQRALQLDGCGLRVELAAAARPVGVVGDLDRRALRGRDTRAAGGLVVLQHPVQRGVGADDHQRGTGRQRDELGAGSGTVQLRAVGERGRAAGDDAGDVGAVTADRQGVGVDAVRDLDHLAGDLERVAGDLVVGDDGGGAVLLL